MKNFTDAKYNLELRKFNNRRDSVPPNKQRKIMKYKIDITDCTIREFESIVRVWKVIPGEYYIEREGDKVYAVLIQNKSLYDVESMPKSIY